MIAKIGREGVRFSISKDDGTNAVKESSSDEQRYGSQAKLMVDGANEEDDDPTHEQEADIRHEHGNLCEENRFESNEENCQTPNDAKQHPACGSTKDS